MPQLLRAIRINRWDRGQAGISTKEIPADALTDLRTTQNKLSVWLLNKNSTHINRIIAALAGTRDKLANFDYLTFNQKIIPKVDIKQCHVNGDSPDDELNREFHYDLIEISGDRLLKLATYLYFNGKAERLLPKQVALLIFEGVKNGQIDESKIKYYDKVLKKVAP